MVKFFFFRKLILLLFIFYSINISCQNIASNSISELVDFAQKIYGSDDRLVNGVISQIRITDTENHPFFMKNEWFDGDIFSNGVKFSNIAIKYNIEIDQIFFINRNNSYMAPNTILNKSIIDSLRIEEHLFVNSDKLTVKSKLPLGFVEVFYRGNFTSFLKHRIAHLKRQANSNIKTKPGTLTNIEYYNLRPLIYIIRNDELVCLKSKKDFIKEFYPFRKDIQKFIHQNKIRFNKAKRIKLFLLLKYCDEISSEQRENK